MGTVRYTTVNGEVIAQTRDGVRRRFVPDPLGSTVAMLDNTQTATDTFSYWPYGEVASRTGTTETPFHYVGTQGYYKDNATRSYVRARYLDSSAGRWFTEDLVSVINEYAYADSNPIALTDRDGLQARPGVGHAVCIPFRKRGGIVVRRQPLLGGFQKCLQKHFNEIDMSKLGSGCCNAVKRDITDDPDKFALHTGIAIGKCVVEGGATVPAIILCILTDIAGDLGATCTAGALRATVGPVFEKCLYSNLQPCTPLL